MRITSAKEGKGRANSSILLEYHREQRAKESMIG